MRALFHAGDLGDKPISYVGVAATRRVSHWTFALAMMVVHAQAGHASVRHATVTPRTRVRPNIAHATKRPDPARQLGDSIVAFALHAEGRQVGDGECFSLADQALAKAGARSAAAYSEITPDGDYVWGKAVSLAAAMPGDIVQFRDFRIVRHVTTIERGDDGSMSSMQSQEMEQRDHHTAIVTQNFGTSLAIAEQNMEPLGRIVQRSTIEIASGTTRRSNAGTETTTDVTVNGDLRVYRPQRLQAIAVAVPLQSGS